MKNELELSEEEKKKYVIWILEECNAPINELEWLVSKLPLDIQNDIRDNVLKFIK